MSVGAVVLAAGEGTRMRSALPKVLHAVAGRPLVAWVLDALRGAGAGHTVVVVGNGADAVRDALPDGVAVAVQEERLGTGDAARVGLASLDPACDTVVVACGDTPLLTRELLSRLVTAHTEGGHHATLVTGVLDDAGAYGRVLRNGDGFVTRIVEARDASPEELAVGEFNAGLYAFDRAALAAAIGRLGTHNAQGELYLTDVVELLDGPVGAVIAGDVREVTGVNTRVELAECEAVAQERLRRDLMLAGVSMPDPARVYVDAGVEVGEDTTLLPGTFLRGATTVGRGCTIGPDVVATDTVIGDGTYAVSAHMIRSRVGARCQIGPFAYLRPDTRLADGVKVGTYVELKNTELGEGTKVPHLSYLGDATVGSGSNIGAGNITANYDGAHKHRTVIGDKAFTSCDCVLVAPVRIGDGAWTAAGSIITEDVPDGGLGIARARQRNIEGWAERRAAKEEQG
ncbi:MAG: bifunctional UDP-N-acetylglucosamine diphosphorylase/glucosamine-1-phosphate N-acetyltransferase GlmU [Actinomycetota bacterium]